MKKLDDISRETPFKVPDGYFDRLPGIIQARVAKPEPRFWFAPGLKFAMPALALVVALTIWFTNRDGNSIEEQLNEIQTEQLMAYLEESELSDDLLNEEVTLSEEDLYELEENVFSSMEPIDFTSEELNIEPDNF
jgi:hypothetical protein